MKIVTLITKYILSLFLIHALCLQAAESMPPFYPFKPRDLASLRKISKAESIPNSPDLNLAWSLYSKVQGSWRPNAEKPNRETVSQLDSLKAKLEGTSKPEWFQNQLNSSEAPNSSVSIPNQIGDDVFIDQSDSPDYQNQKALAIVYLAEHELDRADAVDHAGRYLTLLTIKHPWDWEIHSLYARLLCDARLAPQSLQEAIMSIYLNPSPNLDDLRFFAFIGAATKLFECDVIEKIITAAAVDEVTAQNAIVHARKLFSSSTKIENTPSKAP